MIKKLNALLANLVVEYHKLQNFHWYVKGPQFFMVHEKLEEYFNYINGCVDEVGELILMEEGEPLGSLKEFLEFSTIKEAQMKYLEPKDIYPLVMEDFKMLFEGAKVVKEEADQTNNYVVSAKMDGIMEELSKQLWMLRQTTK